MGGLVKMKAKSKTTRQGEKVEYYYSMYDGLTMLISAWELSG
jgi:hypothetical protein